MEKDEHTLQSVCTRLEEIIGEQEQRLELAQEEVKSVNQDARLPRQEIDKTTTAAALELLKHTLASIQGGLKILKDHYQVYPEDQDVLANIAKLWQAESCGQLTELAIQEKARRKVLQEEIQKKLLCISENQKVLDVLNQEKSNLENRQEELEKQKIRDLEEKLANVKRLYGEMKYHLKETVERYFPDPKVPGYMGMYTLLNELTMRLQNRERDTYVKITNTMWPYYIESLERHGIIERHPTDKEKIRIIDFSDGRLGS